MYWDKQHFAFRQIIICCECSNKATICKKKIPLNMSFKIYLMFHWLIIRVNVFCFCFLNFENILPVAFNITVQLVTDRGKTYKEPLTDIVLNHTNKAV